MTPLEMISDDREDYEDDKNDAQSYIGSEKVTLISYEVFRGFFLVNSVKKKKKKAVTRWIIYSTKLETRALAKCSLDRKVASLNHPSKPRSTNSRLRTGEPILLLRVAGPSGSRVRDEASRK